MTKALDAKERFVLGQERRKQVRRTVHAEWKASERRESPLKLLAASMRGRVPALVALKYERMAVSPFGYFRGAVPVMAYDLSLVGNTGILSQLCGDAHVQNLGAYAGPDGRLLFDINDFDETMVGPFEWDVKRMATSLVLAGRDAGVKNVHCREAAAAFLERYRACIALFARMPVLEVARYQVHRLKNISPVEGILRMAERSTPMHTLLTLTEPGKTAAPQSDRVFKTIAPVLTQMRGKQAERVVASLELYAASLLRERHHLFSQYRPVDVAFKVVGMGSVGLRDYCVYMEGNGPKDASVCGELLARGHARSGDCPMLAGYLGKSARFDDAVAKFAEAYADQTERDWRELVRRMKKPGKNTAKSHRNP